MYHVEETMYSVNNRIVQLLEGNGRCSFQVLLDKSSEKRALSEEPKMNELLSKYGMYLQNLLQSKEHMPRIMLMSSGLLY